jgi:hypothetical protein
MQGVLFNIFWFVYPKFDDFAEKKIVFISMLDAFIFC